MDKLDKGGQFILSGSRNFIFYVVLGVIFLIASLVLAFSSISAGFVAFGTIILRYNPFLEILAFVCLGAGGYLMFLAGRAKPPSAALRKTLVEQVKSVEESQ